MNKKFFMDRRSGQDRRSGKDQRRNPRLELPGKQRRKQADRRAANRSTVDDFYAMHDLNPDDFKVGGSVH